MVRNSTWGTLIRLLLTPFKSQALHAEQTSCQEVVQADASSLLAAERHRSWSLIEMENLCMEWFQSLQCFLCKVGCISEGWKCLAKVGRV